MSDKHVSDGRQTPCCPACQRDDQLWSIQVVSVHHLGNDNWQSEQEDGLGDINSSADCVACGWSGQVSDLYQPPMSTAEAMAIVIDAANAHATDLANESDPRAERIAFAARMLSRE